MLKIRSIRTLYAYQLGRRVPCLRLAGMGYGVTCMKLHNQVCTLELAQKLKELGVGQQSTFYWCKPEDSPEMTYPNWILNFGKITSLNRSLPWQYLAAFTVAELGEMLPDEFDADEVTCFITITRGLRRYWSVGYRPNGNPWVRYAHDGDTEADARAKMLIYLLENKLIVPSHVFG